MQPLFWALNTPVQLVHVSSHHSFPCVASEDFQKATFWRTRSMVFVTFTSFTYRIISNYTTQLEHSKGHSRWTLTTSFIIHSSPSDLHRLLVQLQTLLTTPFISIPKLPELGWEQLWVGIIEGHSALKKNTNIILVSLRWVQRHLGRHHASV